MKERPILFSAPMVRALLAGTKTQTRRVAPITELNIKQHDHGMVTWGVKFSKPVKKAISSHSGGKLTDDQARSVIASMFCPYGAPGDRLWVRETWAHVPLREDDGGQGDRMGAIYRADGEEALDQIPDEWDFMGKWTPSIHMPRWASRITLEITAVRVERLHEITEADAIAEGVDSSDFEPPPEEGAGYEFSHRAGYARLWDRINGPGSWDLNPWVWVVSFKRIES